MILVSEPEIIESFKPDRIVLSLQLQKSGDKKMSIKTLGNREQIIEYLTDHAEASSSEIADLLGLKPSRTKTLLAGLIVDGLLETSGGNRNRTYRLKM